MFHKHPEQLTRESFTYFDVYSHGKGAEKAQWYSARLRAECSEFESRQELGMLLFIPASSSVLGPTKPPIQWVSGALTLGIKRSGREADHSPPSSAEVKNAWSYTSTPQILIHGVLLS
jgi:hypothetical protein